MRTGKFGTKKRLGKENYRLHRNFVSAPKITYSSSGGNAYVENRIIPTEDRTTFERVDLVNPYFLISALKFGLRTGGRA